jgi:hypothetical protein
MYSAGVMLAQGPPGVASNQAEAAPKRAPHPYPAHHELGIHHALMGTLYGR